MAIEQFLNPQGGEEDDLEIVAMDEIAKVYGIGDKTHETDKEDIVIPRVGYSEAMKALQKLCLYEEQH